VASDPGAISGTGGYTVITLNVNNGQQIKIFQEREDGTIYAETHNSSGERRGVTFISPGDMTIMLNWLRYQREHGNESLSF